MQALTIESLEGTQAQKIMVSLSKGRVVLLRGEITEGGIVLSFTNKINCK
jgi:hypothetical protein